MISGSSLSVDTAITASSILVTSDMRFGDASNDTCRFTGSITISGSLSLPSGSVPTSVSSSGTIGEIRWDSGAVYICIATNTWRKSTLATF